MEARTLEQAILHNFGVSLKTIYNLDIIDFSNPNYVHKFGKESEKWDGKSIILADDSIVARIHYIFDRYEPDGRKCLVLPKKAYDYLSDEDRSMCDVIYDCYSNQDLTLYNKDPFYDGYSIKLKMNAPDSIRNATALFRISRIATSLIRSDAFKATDWSFNRYDYVKNFLESMFPDLEALPAYEDLSNDKVRVALFLSDYMYIEDDIDLESRVLPNSVIDDYASSAKRAKDALENSLISVKMPSYVFKSKISIVKRLNILRNHMSSIGMKM